MSAVIPETGVFFSFYTMTINAQVFSTRDISLHYQSDFQHLSVLSQQLRIRVFGITAMPFHTGGAGN